MIPPASITVGQFDDPSLTALLLIGLLFLTALSGLALGALLWLRNRAGKGSKRQQKESDST